MMEKKRVIGKAINSAYCKGHLYDLDEVEYNRAIEAGEVEDYVKPEKVVKPKRKSKKQ